MEVGGSYMRIIRVKSFLIDEPRVKSNAFVGLITGAPCAQQPE